MINPSYPGVLNAKDRANLDDIQYRNYVKPVFFRFNIHDIKRSRIIVKLPRNSLICKSILITVEEPWNNSAHFLHLGTDENQSFIGAVYLNSKRVNIITGAVETEQLLTNDGFGNIFYDETNIRLTILPVTSLSIQGSGFGLLEYVLLDNVPGFRIS